MNTDDLQEKLQSGWIKLYRTSTEHWIFPKNKPLTQFEAWIVMLLEVNHTDNKIQYGYDIIECKRGDSLNSLDRWSQIFNWHKSKVRRYFKMLEKDSMIVLNECKKTTHITICNYDKYQGERHESETQATRKRHASETQATPNKNDNKDNNENNDNKFNFKKSLLNLGIETQIVEDWLKVRKVKKASNTKTAFESLLREFEKTQLSANDCIKKSVENSWSGFKASWLSNINGFNNQQQPALIYTPPKIKKIE